MGGQGVFLSHASLSRAQRPCEKVVASHMGGLDPASLLGNASTQREPGTSPWTLHRRETVSYRVTPQGIGAICYFIHFD